MEHAQCILQGREVICKCTSIAFCKLPYGSTSGISSNMKLIYSPLRCKTSMQTHCGLMNCTGNSPETSLEAYKVLHQLQVFHIALLFSSLPFV